ncbi:major tail protein [Enterococcus termitis]
MEILGEEVDEEDGVQTEQSDASSSPFALMFQFEGDKKAVRHVLYNCSANRPGLGSATGKNVNTTELSFNATPRPGDKKVKTKTTENTKPTVYDNWFSSVYEKTMGA